MTCDKEGMAMISAIMVILLLWYCMYRLSKKDYEKRYNKKLKFKDTFNPNNWDKLH